MYTRFFFIIALLFVSLLELAAQDKLAITAQIRQRYEMDNKDFNNDTNFNNYNLLRTRLGFDFKPSDDVQAFIQLQDARVFGEETSTLTDGSANNLDLHQGYIRLANLFELPVDLKLGRFEASYGTQRLIGAVGWHNIGRSFDGVIFNYHGEGLTIDFFNFKEVEGQVIDDTGDKNVFGAWADVQLFKTYKTQFYAMLQKSKPSSGINRYTFGTELSMKKDNYYHTIEAAYQTGTLLEDDVAAFMAAATVGFVFNQLALAPDVSVGVDYLSGDDDLTDGKYKSFDTMYATNHKFYGFMDYFTNLPVHTANLGLMDIHAGVAVKLADKFNGQLDFHMFQSAEQGLDADGNKVSDFGNEIDLTLKHAYNSNVAFVAGASVFTPGKLFEVSKGKDASSWLYLMTIVSL
jgi:hypothetical protein